MGSKLGGLIQSRRFWVAVAGVLLVVFQDMGLPVSPDQVQMLVLLLAGWIVGDSIRSTGPVVANLILVAGLVNPVFSADFHDQCRAATVRIRNGSSLGTGTVFHENETYIYVLTNAHVAGTQLGNRVACEFWASGHQSRPIQGETVLVSYVPGAYRDIAVVRIPHASLGGYRPVVIRLAEDNRPASYERLYSVGCPSGRWPTSFEGFSLGRDQSGGDTIHFVPMPAGGRSGSAIFDLSGETPRIVGLIAWRSTEDGGHGLDGRGETHGYGIAMTHHEVWAGLMGKNLARAGDAPQGAIPVQYATGPRQGQAVPREAPKPESKIPPKQEPPATGTGNDVILLYSDPVAVGPQTQPPQAAGDSCPGGQCPPQQSPQFGGGNIFPSLPQLSQQPSPTPATPPDKDPIWNRPWFPWAAAAALVLLFSWRRITEIPGRTLDAVADRVEQRRQPPSRLQS